VGEIDTLKGEIMFDEIGRKMHKLTTYQNLKQPQSTREIAIPAEYKEIERYFVDKEGRGPKVEDEYLNFEKFVLKTPASIKEEIMVPRRNIVKIRRSGKLNDAFSKLQPVDQTPSFPGGIKALSNFFKDTYYPIEAYQNNTQGLVILDFTVDKSGDVKDFRIIKDLDGGCGEEALRRAEIMPKWKPAMLDGNPVDYPQLLKVYFKKDDYYIYGSTEASSETERKVDTDFSIPKPNFPGGVTALNSYIKSNLLYPKKALTNKIEGAVLIEFIVNSDGTVEDVEVVKDIGSKCGEAAKQMVEGMPAWEPAKYNGTPIASSYQLFVDFYASKYPKRKPVFPSVIIEKSKKEISSELFKTHQSLAILLPEVNLTDKRMIKAKSEKILEKESKLKIEVHQNLYEQLTKFIDKGKIKGIDIQDIEKNKQILSQKNEALEYAEIAKQLGVDAILTLTAAIEEQMNTVKTKNSGGTHRKTSPLNAYNVIFRLYDGSTGELIWEEKKSDEEEFVNIKHTKIIGGIFKDVLNNTFPYSEN